MKRKLKQLDAMEVAWRNCQQCGLSLGRSKVVNWRGSPDAPLAIIGEPPGADEDQQGLPYVGRSGRMLDGLLAQAGLKPSTDVFIVNSVGCMPVGFRPSVSEFEACHPRIEYLISVVAPRAVLLLGPIALRFVDSQARQPEIEFTYKDVVSVYPAIASLATLTEPRDADVLLSDIRKAWELARAKA